MKRHHVESSALESIGYDADEQTLEVEFKEGGAVWQYKDLTPATFKRFIRAESLGNFFTTKIKGNHKEVRIK